MSGWIEGNEIRILPVIEKDSHDHHHCQDHHLLHIVISYL